MGAKVCSPSLYIYPSNQSGEVIPPTASGILKFTNSTSFTNTVVTESGHSISVPPAGSQLAVPQHLQDEWTPQIRARLPRILDNGRQIDYFRICWDSVSPNQQPLITRHPDARLGNIYFAVGGSFHCWKFLPTIGGYVVKVLEGRRGNGARDKAWQWKRGQKEEGGVHQHLTPQQELLSQHPA